tara:strand:- start:1287 stop:1853 length:567 start_codon:yes stop_codon:yes gene_type:complete
MDSSASYNINITLHVLILFTFLTIFFFTFLSQVEVKNVNHVMSKLVGDQTKNTLDLIKSNSDKIPELSISKDNLSTVANNMEKSSKVPIKSISDNNKKLKKISIIMISCIFLLLVGMIIYYKVYKKYDIGFSHILIENLIIFSFAGIIEYLFFTNVAVKYVPVTPDVASSTILDGIKDKFNNSLFKKN